MNKDLTRGEFGGAPENPSLEDVVAAAFSAFGLRCEIVRISLGAGGGILLSSLEINQFGSHLARGLKLRGFCSATFPTTPMQGVFIGAEEAIETLRLREALVQELAELHPVMDDVEFLQRL